MFELQLAKYGSNLLAQPSMVCSLVFKTHSFCHNVHIDTFLSPPSPPPQPPRPRPWPSLLLLHLPSLRLLLLVQLTPTHTISLYPPQFPLPQLVFSETHRSSSLPSLLEQKNHCNSDYNKCGFVLHIIFYMFLIVRDSCTAVHLKPLVRQYYS